jgi:hypothetical protein
VKNEQNPVTAKNDSKAGTSPAIPVASEIAALEAFLKDQKKAQADARKQLAQLKVHARRAKIAHRDEERERIEEAKTERTYRTFWSVIPLASGGPENRKAAIAKVQAILDEFKTDSVNQRYTPAAIKARKDALILAGGGKVGPVPPADPADDDDDSAE